MTMKFTEEQLKNFDKNTLIQLFLSQQEQLESIDNKLQLVLEQLADMNRRRYGRSSERSSENDQLSFTIEDGELVFNEADAMAYEDACDRDDEETVTVRRKKTKGKKEADISGLPVERIDHEMTDEELHAFYNGESWKRLPDEIYNRYKFTPATVSVEEHHVAVYSGTSSERMIKADHPKQLLRNSLASPSTVAGIMNAKYVNGAPLYRVEAEYHRYGINISRQTMANWVIQCADRYLAVLYDRIHEKLYDYHVIQADETPVLVNKDGREAGSKSYMWVYRTGKMYDNALVLYDYQKTRKADHPREFLKDFNGVCVTDGYQVYHTIEKERGDLTIAGCWAHARRRFDEAVKALPKNERKSCTAAKALKLIQAVYREEDKLKELSAEDRAEQRQLIIKPLVEAYFAWVHKTEPHVMRNSKTHKGLTYSINQERYLRVFLEDGEVPMDNNAAEQSIRSFCIGKKNWVMIDTVAGARSSAIVYSIAETAKANKLKPYEYFKYLLTEIPQHLDGSDRSFIDNLLPWSDKLPAECRK